MASMSVSPPASDLWAAAPAAGGGPMTSAPPAILVVEGEPTIAGVLVDYLHRAGFSPRHLADGAGALDAVRVAPPALVLMDTMLPGLDGMSLCREIRAFSSVPIIMVGARADEAERVAGLWLGADDFVCKPFSPREVVARVVSVLRRAAPGLDLPAALPVDPATATPTVEVDEPAQRIVVAGRQLDLTPTEFRMLRVLMEHPGRIYTRALILDLAYAQGQDVCDRVVDTHMKNIRRKIAAALPGRDVIRSVYGVGYRFEL